MVPAIGELAGVPIEQPRTPLVREDHPARLGEGFALGVSLVTIALLTWGAVHDWPTIRASWPELLAWTAALAILNLLDVATESGLRVAPALPAMIALAVIFPPGAAGLITLLGAVDRREVRRRVSPLSALFNRSQLTLAAVVTAAAAGVMATAWGRSARGITASSVGALAIITLVNYTVTGTAHALTTGASLGSVLRALRVGRTLDFVATWLGWGLLGLLLALAYDVMHLWALVAFSGLAVAGRTLLVRSQSELATEAMAHAKSVALRAMQESIADERRDERRLVALEIHDDLLAAIHRVTLLAQVIRQDLATGRLLELDSDVPMLISAGDTASETLRAMIGGLLESTLGRSGLARAITALVEDLRINAGVDVDVQVADLGSLRQELEMTAYQICREALSNAVRHDGASLVTILVYRDEEYLRAVVADDGVGFDPTSVPGGHFGVVDMRERAAAVGGLVVVNSAPASGTIVAARLPLDPERQ